MTQNLLPRAGSPGRVAACEILVPTAAIRNLIRENKLHQIYSQMQTGQGQHGMITFNQSLYQLLAKRFITVDEAFGRSPDPEELRAMISDGKGGR